MTPPQFDIIATLGNTSGMTATVLGEKTLITKGSLPGWWIVWLSAAGWNAPPTTATAAARCAADAVR